MESGKALILKSVTKKGVTPFKAADITNETGLTRQLVNYHIKRFVDNGWLQKTGQWYLIIDLEELIEDLVNTSVNDEGARKPETSTVLGQQRDVAEIAQNIIQGRALGVPMCDEFFTTLRNEIDETVDLWRRVRKWMNNYHPSIETAAKTYMKEDVVKTYQLMTSTLGVAPRITEEDWQKHGLKLAKEVLDK